MFSGHSGNVGEGVRYRICIGSLSISATAGRGLYMSASLPLLPSLPSSLLSSLPSLLLALPAVAVVIIEDRRSERLLFNSTLQEQERRQT